MNTSKLNWEPINTYIMTSYFSKKLKLLKIREKLENYIPAYWFWYNRVLYIHDSRLIYYVF